MFFLTHSSLPGIFFKCIIHIAVIGKSAAVADINQRKFTFHQQCFALRYRVRSEIH